MTTRRSVREALATKLREQMVGTGKACQAVYEYQKERLKGVVPCVVVVSEPLESLIVEEVGPATIYNVGVHTFAYYEDVGTGTVDAPEYDEQDSENDMDEMAEEIRITHKLYGERTDEDDPEWLFWYLRKSVVDSYTDLEGREFRHEYFPCVMVCEEDDASA